MDDVERMYRHLVKTIRTSSPHLLTQPFQVADLYATILPYRLHRRDLGLETNQDYEMAMLELLSGGRGYLVVEDRMREVLGTSLKSPNPDPQLIREFASSRISLAPDAVRKVDPEALPALPASAATAPTAPVGVPITEAEIRPSRGGAGSSGSGPVAPPASPSSPRPGGATASPPPTNTRRPARPIYLAQDGECPHCRGALPGGRPLVFCPHCGQDLTVQHCPACGSELEHDWKFCVTCGRAVAST